MVQLAAKPYNSNPTRLQTRALSHTQTYSEADNLLSANFWPTSYNILPTYFLFGDL